MGDITIGKPIVGENESGLVHWAEAEVSDGIITKLCHVEFIDMPLVDENGELRMDAVGSMLLSKFYEPEYVEPEPELDEFGKPIKIEPLEEPMIEEPVIFTAEQIEYIGQRKTKLAILQKAVAKMPDVKVIQDAAMPIDIEPIKEEPIKEG